jgi:hypothetical protein
VVGGGGNDTITVSKVAALGSSSSLDGGTGTVDTLAITDTGYTDINFATLATNGVVVGIEKVTFASDAANTTHAVTLATGMTQVVIDSSATGEVFTFTATAAQANAITSITDTSNSSSTTKLSISSAGTVDFANGSATDDVLTGIDLIAYGDVAVTLALNNDPLAVTQTRTATDDAQTVTFGDLSAAQSANIGSKGVVTFNIAAAALVTIAVADLDSTISNAQSDFAVTADAAATASLNVTGSGGNFNLAGDADVAMTAIDVTNINTSTASVVVASVGTSEMVGKLNLGTVTGHSVHLDTAGTQDAAVTVQGFAAGASGDKILLSQDTSTSVGTTGLTTTKILPGIATSGVLVSGWATTAAAAADLVVLSSAATQINGALTATTSGGAVAAAIIAAGLVGDSTSRYGYIVLDNGTDTGIYRVNLVGNAGGSSTTVVDSAADLTSIQLVGILEGLSDSSTLLATNFGG